MIARRDVLAGSGAALLTSSVVAQTTRRKPKLPPGRDPGGVAVAVIGDGIDYTDPVIAARLARDGEGDLIGWDFIDDDNRPFAAGNEGNSVLRTVIGAAPSARFVPVRVTRASSAVDIRALGFALQTPARLIVLPGEISQPDDIQTLRGIAAVARSALVIAVASVAAGPPVSLPAVDNVLFVADPAAVITALRLAVRILELEVVESGEVLKRRVVASPEFRRAR